MHCSIPNRIILDACSYVFSNNCHFGLRIEKILESGTSVCLGSFAETFFLTWYIRISMIFKTYFLKFEMISTF